MHALKHSPMPPPFGFENCVPKTTVPGGQFDCGSVVISAAEQSFDVALLAHNKALAAPLDERRAAEQESIGRAGQTEVLVICFAETPELYRHGDAVIRGFRDNCQ